MRIDKFRLHKATNLNFLSTDPLQNFVKQQWQSPYFGHRFQREALEWRRVHIES